MWKWRYPASLLGTTWVRDDLEKGVMVHDNRRNFFRIRSERQCEVSFDGKRLTGVIVDESIGGFRLRVPTLGTLSSLTDVDLALEGETIAVRAVSVVREGAIGFSVGLQRREGVDSPEVAHYLTRDFVSVGGCTVACRIKEHMDNDKVRILMPAGNEFTVASGQLTCLTEHERAQHLTDSALSRTAAQFYSSMGIAVSGADKIVAYEFYDLPAESRTTSR